MLEVADVFSRYGDEYLHKFGDKMLPSHRRAFADILKCRTDVMGGHVFRCDKCGTGITLITPVEIAVARSVIRMIRQHGLSRGIKNCWTLNITMLFLHCHRSYGGLYAFIKRKFTEP